MREEKTFRVVVFRFETDASTNYTRYMITKNYMPFFPGNQWLELKSIFVNVEYPTDDCSDSTFSSAKLPNTSSCKNSRTW